MVFFLLPEDADLERGQTLAQAASEAESALRRLVDDTREARDSRRLGRALLESFIASAVGLALVAVVWRGRSATVLRLATLMRRRTTDLTIAGTVVFHRERWLAVARGGVQGLSWVLLAVISYEWLSFVLGRFPWTRPWADQLSGYLWGVMAGILSGIANALPDLFVALVIFALAKASIGLLRPIFSRIEAGQGQLGWLDADTVRPARRLVQVSIWLFALVMAYPYLPGSGSEAFKGMSVLLGLMISLGASSVVGQGASGLILMFTRTLRVGEYVRVDSHEGTVCAIGMFTTRMRTGLGEELTLPNALVLGTVTKNYSRAVKGPGFIVDTAVTIGYDTPWRQVEAMLIEAALRTPGVLKLPEPQVFQTGLSDFYPEYRLVCQAVPSLPRPRAEVLSKLHACIQDVFNEHGVQIMSPHYNRDPDSPKFVPRSAWFASPAKAPDVDGKPD
ncbi:mechanosensitive ion channel family protein [Ideonella sp.]|uniref:mechanosensitive ion channel family protein n=1 Tax=Ideonella sp. TaxID=1929293 RepID=UPI003BB7D7EB